MTVCSVYLGSLEDPKFKWEGGDWNGNVPAAISQDFPPMGEHYNADFHRWVASSDVECKETDFAACVTRVTKAQILDFISMGYLGKEHLPWVELPLQALNEFVSTLNEDRVYALVATEW